MRLVVQKRRLDDRLLFCFSCFMNYPLVKPILRLQATARCFLLKYILAPLRCSYTVWNQLSGDFGELDSILSTTPFYPAVQRVGRQLYSTIGQQIGWDAQPVRKLSSLL